MEKKRMVKFIVIIAVVVAMLLATIGLVACDNYECACEPYKHECTEECGDFCLSISVDCARLERGGSLKVTITFKNLSGQTLELSELGLISQSPFGYRYGLPAMMIFEDLIIKNQDNITHTSIITHSALTGGTFGGLSRGTHELIFSTRFYINEERVNVNSNTILITVR